MNRHLGDEVKRLAYALDISQCELAVRAQVSRSAVIRFLNQEGDTQAGTLVKILDALGINVSEIVSKTMIERLGAKAEPTFGEAVVRLLLLLDPVIRKTVLLILIRQTEDARAYEYERHVLFQALESLENGNGNEEENL